MVLDAQSMLRSRDRQRVLYFDIEGTLVRPGFGAAKPALARGAFERLVREAGFDRLVCVSDAVSVARAVKAAGGPDVYRTLFDACRGTIQDERWFRRVTRVTPEPLDRGRYLPRFGDWYYIDDWAWLHVKRAGRSDLLRGEGPRRILQCVGSSNGCEVSRWLRECVPVRRSQHALQTPSARLQDLQPMTWRASQDVCHSLASTDRRQPRMVRPERAQQPLPASPARALRHRTDS